MDARALELLAQIKQRLVEIDDSMRKQYADLDGRLTNLENRLDKQPATIAAFPELLEIDID